MKQIYFVLILFIVLIFIYLFINKKKLTLKNTENFLIQSKKTQQYLL